MTDDDQRWFAFARHDGRREEHVFDSHDEARAWRDRVAVQATEVTAYGVLPEAMREQSRRVFA